MHVTLEQRILGEMKGGEALSSEQITARLRMQGVGTVTSTLNKLLTQKKVERDGISNRFRLVQPQ